MIIETLKSELKKMGIEAEDFENLQSKDGIYVYRICLGGKTAVIKYFEKDEYKREILCYDKLRNSNIDTIPILNQTDRCIVMEDMDSSEKYRLGIKDGLHDEEVIKSLAKWYKDFHSVKLTDWEKENFYCEAKLITMENIEKIKQFNSDNECFKLLEIYGDKLFNQYKNYQICLNYNDFYYTNFIVAKDKTSAFMFDYNLLGIGYRYSDIRNVCSALSDEMKEVFLREYGGFDVKEKVTDEWMSPLIDLIYASQRDSFPDWAEESLEKLRNGSISSTMMFSLKTIRDNRI